MGESSGEFTRLSTDLAALPPPAQFIARHQGKPRPSRLEPARAALAWLTAFVAVNREHRNRVQRRDLLWKASAPHRGMPVVEAQGRLYDKAA